MIYKIMKLASETNQDNQDHTRKQHSSHITKEICIKTPKSLHKYNIKFETVLYR